jgi:hypothetical protein
MVAPANSSTAGVVVVVVRVVVESVVGGVVVLDEVVLTEVAVGDVFGGTEDGLEQAMVIHSSVAAAATDLTSSSFKRVLGPDRDCRG